MTGDYFRPAARHGEFYIPVQTQPNNSFNKVLLVEIIPIVDGVYPPLYATLRAMD